MYSSHTEIDLDGFEKRVALKQVWRYHIYDDVWYRSNVWDHGVRIFYLLTSCQTEIMQVFPHLDFKKVQILALVHDDVEILTWDVQAGNKQNMSPEQVAQVDKSEEQAIEKLREISPKNVEGYNYGDLLFEVYKKETREAQLLKFFDHLDAFGDALHEFFAGNDNTMLTWVENQYGKTKTPLDYYIERYAEPEKYYPLMKDIFYKKFEKYTPFELGFERWNFEQEVTHYHPHTEESIVQDSGYEIYNWWKRVVLVSSVWEITENLLKFSAGRYIENS